MLVKSYHIPCVSFPSILKLSKKLLCYPKCFVACILTGILAVAGVVGIYAVPFEHAVALHTGLYNETYFTIGLSDKG
jgi:hypothetical protein